ncbi:cache domain-containing protein [Echinicola marina]|uniref:cache domain-containing protein n=1 Tax=Echinicola marina TaxID=2859768 RepID=UPI001CF68339|nr:cache domain-containing protein [Echinicola marina]UCS91533.1 cache domain-containing protein [Echinicola marina]
MKYRFFLLIWCILAFFCGCSEEKSELHPEEFELLDSIVYRIESKLYPLEKDIDELSAYAAYLFAHKDQYALKAKKEQYKNTEQGVIYRESAKEDVSSVFVSVITPDRTEAIHQVYYTEALDSAFTHVLADQPLISQVYFNTRFQMCRIYPQLDVLSVFEDDLDLTKFNFYFMADEVRNPEKKRKWLKDIYIDPAGRGWILSLIHPVYHNQELQGVMGLDITVNDLISEFLSYKDKKLVLVDDSGNVVAGTSDAIEILKLPPLRNHTYVETINSNNFRREDYNLFKSKSKEVRKMVSKFILEKDNKFILDGEYDSKKYKALCRPMDLIEWYLIDIEG